MNGQLARRHFFIPSAGYARGFKGEAGNFSTPKKSPLFGYASRCAATVLQMGCGEVRVDCRDLAKYGTTWWAWWAFHLSDFRRISGTV
jgi:hypothetical protein